MLQGTNKDSMLVMHVASFEADTDSSYQGNEKDLKKEKLA